MRIRTSRRLALATPLLVALVVLAGCTTTATVTVQVTTTALPTSTSAPTATATPAPQPGVCNPADFPTQTAGGPSEGFSYPPLTYFYDIGPAAGNNYHVLCSSGTPASIQAYLLAALPAGGWTVTASTSTTISAQDPTSPPSGLCSSVDITLGSHAGYPGEWDADFHPPISAC